MTRGDLRRLLASPDAVDDGVRSVLTPSIACDGLTPSEAGTCQH